MNKNTERKSRQLSQLLDEYSLKDIISIFSSVDSKIVALHNCSADDFLTLNSHLKRYYKDAKDISENAGKIFDIIAGKDSRKIFNEFNTFHNKLDAQVNYFEEDLDFSINSLSKILANLDFTFVPLKNFGQNLMSLKFILTNIKINLTGQSKEKAKKQNQYVNKIIELIGKIKSNFPNFDEDLSELKMSIKETHSKLEKIRIEITSDVEIILEKIRSNIGFLSNKHEEALNDIPKLQQKTEHCFNSLSKIITNLQYQDIIRQKMENIQGTYNELIKELNDIEENEQDKIVLFKQAKYAAQIPHIAELQIAQLIQTNKEYQNAIQLITNQFLEIGQDMKVIAEMCHQIASYTSTSGETHFDDILQRLKDATNIINDFIQARNQFNINIKKIIKKISNLTDSFDYILQLDENLQLFTRETVAVQKEEEKQDEFSKLFKQLRDIAKDLRLNISKCQKLFDQTLLIGKELNSKLLTQQNEDENNQNLTENIKELLEVIEQENKKVIELLIRNEKFSNDVAEQIKKSVEEVTYYDFFEKTIEAIILDLNNIYRRLISEYYNIKDAHKFDELKPIEELYTTKSEHEIHNRLISDENKEDEEDNIEFF